MATRCLKWEASGVRFLVVQAAFAFLSPGWIWSKSIVQVLFGGSFSEAHWHFPDSEFSSALSCLTEQVSINLNPREKGLRCAPFSLKNSLGILTKFLSLSPTTFKFFMKEENI